MQPHDDDVHDPDAGPGPASTATGLLRRARDGGSGPATGPGAGGTTGVGPWVPGGPGRWWVTLLGVGAVLFATLVLTSGVLDDYQKDRLTVFTSGEAEIGQSLGALAALGGCGTAALASLKAGKAPDPALTVAYGCDVKY